MHRAVLVPLNSMIAIAAIMLAASIFALGGKPAAAAGDDTPVVLELFTSQGCSSCPEADRILGDIASMRDDIVALSVHVNYWDYLGWEDRFASPALTRRQHKYSESLGLSYVYTPQLVINGRHHVVGSHKDKIMRQIADAKGESELSLPITITPGDDGGLHVSIHGDADNAEEAVVWIIGFDREHRTKVAAGENAGRELANHRVVRSFRQIATWRGAPLELDISAADLRAGSGDGCAILVQAGGGTGPILGARQIWLDQGLF